MGCTNSTQVVQISSNIIAAQIRRLKIYSEQQKGKLSAQGHKEQSNLMKQFNKPKNMRTFAAQPILISQIVQIMNKMHVYEVIKGHCMKILDYTHHITKKQLARQTLYPSFKVILYASLILKDKEVIKVQRHLRDSYTDLIPAKDQQIDSEIMKHMKQSVQPSKTMINDYVLKLCSQENMQLEDINQNYHSFKYGG